MIGIIEYGLGNVSAFVNILKKLEVIVLHCKRNSACGMFSWLLQFTYLPLIHC